LRTVLAEQVTGSGADIIRAELSGIVRPDTACIASDVCQHVATRRSASKLPQAESTEAYEAVRALYRGDFLAEPYYEWAHRRANDGLTLREQYREEYYRVTQRLAELYRHQEQPGRAVILHRDILKLEPTLEDVVRGRYRCYQNLGDRRALLSEHCHLRDAIWQMLKSSDDPDDNPEL
jgi:two-component SAPR family response regulator